MKESVFQRKCHISKNKIGGEEETFWTMNYNQIKVIFHALDFWWALSSFPSSIFLDVDILFVEPPKNDVNMVHLM